jgi:hypothetical protein
MAKERSLFTLPNYLGQLRPVAWSEILITPALAQSLMDAALSSCPSCSGQGYRMLEGKAHPCLCLNRAAVRTKNP